MKKTITAVLVSFALTACGGGGDSSSSTPAAKSLKLSFYGQPLVTNSTTSHAQLTARAATASAPIASSSAAGATVQTLQEALVARGVPAAVSAQVMDGTTLHEIVQGENDGLPPTSDQFKTDPSEWLIVNFQLDDMVSTVDVPTQQAAISQFIDDLAVFVQRAAVSGKRVFAVVPIQTCDAEPGFSAAYGLFYAISQASNKSSLSTVGALSINLTTPEHLGADCRTPDASLLNARVQAVADSIASQYQATIAARN